MCKRVLAGIVLTAIIVSVCFAVPKKSLTKAVSNTTNAKKQIQTIIIDAGHGGLTNTIMAIFFDRLNKRKTSLERSLRENFTK